MFIESHKNAAKICLNYANLSKNRNEEIIVWGMSVSLFNNAACQFV